MGLFSLAFSVSTALFSVFLRAEALTSMDDLVFYASDPLEIGCICPLFVWPICDLVEESAIVLRGTILPM